MATKGAAMVVEGQAASLSGSESRLALLYDRHSGDALRLAYLLTGDRALAEDLSQEAFVKVAGKLFALRDPEAFGPYLRRTVVNLTRGYFRRLKVERSYLERERNRAIPAETHMPDLEKRDELWEALATLSPRQRAAIVLRYYEDLSEQQTADALGCSVGAVKSLVNRGMESLRSSINGRDEDA